MLNVLALSDILYLPAWVSTGEHVTTASVLVVGDKPRARTNHNVRQYKNAFNQACAFFLSDCMGQLFASLLRTIPSFFASVQPHGASPTLDVGAASSASTILALTRQILNATVGLRLRMTAGPVADADEDLLSA